MDVAKPFDPADRRARITSQCCKDIQDRMEIKEMDKYKSFARINRRLWRVFDHDMVGGWSPVVKVLAVGLYFILLRLKASSVKHGLLAFLLSYSVKRP